MIGNLSRNILVAVDESSNSRRAVQYVATILGDLPGFKVELLHVIPEPDEDYFPNEEERQAWIKNRRERMEEVLRSLKQELVQVGFPEERVTTTCYMKRCPSVSACILDHQSAGRFGTIVIGRQGISAQEEFLFGSVSNRIVHHASRCAVWVIN